MVIKTVPISSIQPSPFNPRVELQPTDSEYQKLDKSLSVFGYLDPIIWNEQTGHIVGGHQRFRILVAQGYKELEVSVVNFSLEQEKLCSLALNRISGRWDDNKLAAIFEEVQKLPDLDLSLSGFDSDDISRILDSVGESKDPDDFDFDGAVEAIETPVTQRGDVITLGDHRIMCGDSACESDMDKLMQGEKIDLLHTDPPYGCSYLAQNRPDLESRPKKSKRWQALYKDNLNEKEYEQWIEAVLKNIRRYLKEGASAYIWNGHAKFYFMHQVLKQLGFHISTVITWAKPNFAISYGDFNQQTEFAIYSWLENAPHKWYGPTNETNLWEIGRDKASQLIHPTQKSVEIPSRAIRNSSLRGDAVFDGFLGSGSTLLAAESLGRRCRGMEIEPKYVDGIVRRYIAYVGRENVSPEVVSKYMEGAAK